MAITFTNKKVAILGWGVDSQDVEPWLRQQGAWITILDEKENPQAFANLNSYDVLVRSPGIYRYRPELIAAEKAGVTVTSKTKIFFDECPAKIVGVTGTKGKGTTSTLIYEMLKSGGKDVYLGGNIGKGVFDFLPKLTGDSWVVLELSSFQLIDLHRSPQIAVTLMVTSEHQDWHKDPDEYVMAKANITKYQGNGDVSIFNELYPNSVIIGQMGAGLKVGVQRDLWKGKTRLRGAHNKENLAAAAAAARAVGVNEETILAVAKEFRGLEHRLEEVGVVDGVTYYNDSFSTTPETAIAAVQAFSEPEIVILGGSDKGSDYVELGRVITETKNIKAVILIGLMAEKIKQSIGEGVKIIEGAKTMTEIVQQAKDVAVSGDVVILSPACASFDMFKNYKDRGEQFKNIVLSLGW